MKKAYQKRTSQEGFTLIELLVSMGLFIVIMVVASQAFNAIITQASKYSKMEETNIEGVVGLEILRHDLEQTGFGLPWGWRKVATSGSNCESGLCDSTISYNESADTIGANLNDSSTGVPRAFTGLGKGASVLTSAYMGDYFGLKGTTVGRSKSSQRWTYVPFHNISTSTGRISQPMSFGDPPATSERVLAINSNYNIPANDHQLLINPSDNTLFFSNFGMTGMSDNYLPVTDQDTVTLYGVDGTTTPRMPFNRADYFISNAAGTVPPFCAPNTGVLYKAAVKHADGAYDYLPILDCVADMRVVLGWDSDGTGGIRTYSTLPTTAGGTPADIGGPGSASDIGAYLTNPVEIRNRLKVIKVYILAQEGKIDKTYTGPATMVVGANPSAPDNDSSNKGLSTTNNTYTFTTAQRQYRWKLYRIVARPKNLFSNQR